MKFKNYFQQFLTKISTWRRRSKRGDLSQSKFIDLAPTDKADENSVYSDALLFATNNPRVSNIALTGPYGSGKSSIIKSFLRKYNRPVLQISLAAFLPEANTSGHMASKQEIERSIIQQMLYGADASRLPLSRFKRIKTPGKAAILISFYIFAGLLSTWHLWRNSGRIISGAYFVPLTTANWFNLATFAIGVTFLWLTVHQLYVASFGVSLKSISLKDIQIAPIPINQESILNRHLDEIIYFFQSTKYDLVVIEDLDRFNDSDIFVTLREINSLVNENSGVRRTVRFLYALRDDMFANTDRTKFFEFIIPVIPIINSSNSIDKVLEQGRRVSLDDRLNRQFIREASRYLDDLRLIQNIFNEYAIYAACLEAADEKLLDPNKLLAVLIYKNIFPRDFESLHRGKGNLANILNLHAALIVRDEAKYLADISRLEEQIDNAKRQVPADLKELRKIYAMALIEKLPPHTAQIGLPNQPLIDLSLLTANESFDMIIEAPRVDCVIHNNRQRIDISGFQAALNPLKSYQQRKQELERKPLDVTNAALKSIQELRGKIANIRISKFNEAIRANAGELESHFLEFGDKMELAKFLVLEGYLDDTYYQYTSLFHSGRLSPNDNKFLIQIRGFVNPTPDFQIDNPKEVIAAMREEDFRQNFVLNVKIVDCILGDPATYSAHRAKFLGFIAANFARCESFLASYYATGNEVSALVTGLSKTWPGYVPAALSSSKRLSHLVHLVAGLPTPALEALAKRHPEVSGFVSTNLAQILGLGLDFELNRLKALAVEIEDLASIQDFAGTARFLFEEGLYKLTIGNVEFLFHAVLGLDETHLLRTRHYTTVLQTENATLISRIEREFKTYLSDILLKLDDNSQESVPAILSAVAHEEVDFDHLSAFLGRQSAVIPSLDQVPARLQALVVQLARIEPSWENCLAFLGSESFNSESLTAFLNTRTVVAALSTHAVPEGDAAYPLRAFLIENDDLLDEVYRTYIRRLPKPFAKFPENVGTGKMQILIEERKATFSPANFALLDSNQELQVLYVAKSIEKYLGNESAFAIDDQFREKLLAADIRDDQKLAIIQSMDTTLLAGLPARAGAVGAILDRTGVDVSMLDAEAARAVILNSAPIAVQISLLNKSQKILSDTEVRAILSGLPRPFSEITVGYHTPRLAKSDENVDLARWLAARNLISSWTEALFTDEIRINLFRR